MLKLDVSHPPSELTVAVSKPAGAQAPRPDTGESDQRYFTMAIAPCLSPATRAVEIGPGDGRWTARLAPLVRDLVVVDISAEMLDRARARLDAAAMDNVSFLLGSGKDLGPLPSETYDLVFGYDVFSHIPLPETVGYLAEIARVLKDGGMALLHHVVSDAAPALDRLESLDDDAAAHFHGRDALDRMYSRFGLRIDTVWAEGCTALVLARKPADSIVPRLEQALRLAAAARDERALDEAVRRTADVAADLERRLTSLTAALRKSAAGPERLAIVQRIRRLVRG